MTDKAQKAINDSWDSLTEIWGRQMTDLEAFNIAMALATHYKDYLKSKENDISLLRQE